MKRVLSILLSLAMIFVAPTGVYALSDAYGGANHTAIADGATLKDNCNKAALTEDSAAPDGYQVDCGAVGAAVLPTLKASTLFKGSCGKNVKWSLSEEGVLTISGSGKMADYSSYRDVPWADYVNLIQSAKIGSGVTSISPYAFFMAQNMRSVTIAATVKELGTTCFAECLRLTSLTLPDSVKEIPYAMAADCFALESFRADGIEKINDYAFQSVPLKSFNIGKRVKEISSLAFFKMNDVTEFTVSSSNKSFSASDGIIFNSSGKTLLFYPSGKEASSCKIPSKVTKIGDAAFAYSSKLRSVTIPSSVKELGMSAFQGSGIRSVTIPNSVKTAGDFTFYNSDVESIALGTGIKETSYQMFENCYYLTKIKFPSTKLDLYARTFAGCLSLESVSLPSNVKSIGNGCFGDCSGLKSVSAKSIKAVPFQAFLNCRRLTSVSLKGVEEIYRMAFYGCNSLSEITLPKTITYVHNIAFPTTTKVVCKNKRLSKFGYNGYRCLQTITFSGYNNYTEAYKVLELVNKERAANGLKALSMDKDLLDCAMIRAGETALLFSHTRPDSSTVFEMNSKITGENIAAGQSTPASAMNSWMNSEGHRANILSTDYTIIGIGCVKVNGNLFWVQSFGSDECRSVSKPSNKNVTLSVNAAVDEFNEGSIASGVIFSTDGDKTYKIAPTVSLSAKSIKAGKKAQARAYFENCEFGNIVVPENKAFKWSSSNSKAATVNGKGSIKGVHNGKAKIRYKLGYMSASRSIEVTGHSYKTSVVKAKIGKNGKSVKTCTVCGKKKTTTIYCPKKITLSKSNYTYDGKAKKPTVIVKDSRGKKISSKNYSVTYSKGRVKVGKYKVTVKFKGNYSGSKELWFRINP